MHIVPFLLITCLTYYCQYTGPLIIGDLSCGNIHSTRLKIDYEWIHTRFYLHCTYVTHANVEIHFWGHDTYQ